MKYRAAQRRDQPGARAWIVLVALAGSAACGHERPTLYAWGGYEKTLASEGRDPGQELELLSQKVGETEAKGLRVPPGVHAHLGYLLAVAGDTRGAKSEFLREAASFPESAAFMSWLGSRLDRPMPPLRRRTETPSTVTSTRGGNHD